MNSIILAVIFIFIFNWVQVFWEFLRSKWENLENLMINLIIHNVHCKLIFINNLGNGNFSLNYVGEWVHFWPQKGPRIIPD